MKLGILPEPGNIDNKTKKFINEAIDKAILLERERCAKIAENWISEYGLYTSTGEAIAKRIREGK